MNKTNIRYFGSIIIFILTFILSTLIHLTIRDFDAAMSLISILALAIFILAYLIAIPLRNTSIFFLAFVWLVCMIGNGLLSAQFLHKTFGIM